MLPSINILWHLQLIAAISNRGEIIVHASSGLNCILFIALPFTQFMSQCHFHAGAIIKGSSRLPSVTFILRDYMRRLNFNPTIISQNMLLSVGC